MCEHAFGNRGTLLIPAFSIGRTQELLYELEEIIHRHRAAAPPPRRALGRPGHRGRFPAGGRLHRRLRQLKAHWDAEARRKLAPAATRWPSSS
jgi:metallo-beta-lactamase family protein